MTPADLPAGRPPDDATAYFVGTGPFPARPGNSARLLIDGEPAFRRICEVIERAQVRVWAAITFMWPDVVMPDGRGSPLDVLGRAAARGADVRLLFWRPDGETMRFRPNAFWGSPEHIERLRALVAPVQVRWDRAAPGFCQHQKLWLVDDEDLGPLAFVGGINLNPHSMVAPGHQGEGQNHDVYLELAGPSVVDVHASFVERWNGASERFAPDGNWNGGRDGSQDVGRDQRDEEDLNLPSDVLAEATRDCGGATVQIQRTVHPSRSAGRRTRGDASLSTDGAGERTIDEQYLLTLRTARDYLYLENQYLEEPGIVTALHAALRRGVEVVMLVPAVPDLPASAYASAERRAFFEARAALGDHDNFTLCGIAGESTRGRRAPVYVHSKLMLMDDAWATIGSANLHHASLHGNAELNAAVYAPELVRGFRVELFEEHLAEDTSRMDGRSALRRFRAVASGNRTRLESGDHAWQGLAVTLDVATYGEGDWMG